MNYGQPYKKNMPCRYKLKKLKGTLKRFLVWFNNFKKIMSEPLKCDFKSFGFDTCSKIICMSAIG